MTSTRGRAALTGATTVEELDAAQVAVLDASLRSASSARSARCRTTIVARSARA
jgi:hypothetical protein